MRLRKHASGPRPAKEAQARRGRLSSARHILRTRRRSSRRTSRPRSSKQHVASIPAAQNPLFDLTGAFCTVGQRDDVWFLHGLTYPGSALGEPIVRNCTIPTGKQIFLPFINWICVPYPGETIPQNVGFCKDANDLTDLNSLAINGQTRYDLIKRIVQKKAFDLTVPDGNAFGWPSGVFTAVHDGYFALSTQIGGGSPHDPHSGWCIRVRLLH